MNRSRRYPPSVQSGRPSLWPRPRGWATHHFADLVQIVERPVKIDPNTSYQLVLAKRNRKGVVARGAALGKTIKTVTQFQVCAGDFLISRRQIVHGGCGLVPPELDGAIVSNEYLVLTSKEPLLTEYFALLCHTHYLQQTFFHSSVGVDIEKMILRADEWMRFSVHLPPLDQQRDVIRTVAALQTRDSVAIALRGELRQRRRALLTDLLGRHAPTRMRLTQIASVNPESLPEDTDSDFTFAYADLGAVDGGVVSLRPSVRFAEAPSRARRVCRIGDILLATVRPRLQGHARVEAHSELPIVCSTGFAVVRAEDPTIASLIFHQLFGDGVMRQFGALVAGSSFPAVPERDVRALEFLIPDANADRARIASLLDAMETEERVLASLMRRYGELKAEILDRLVRGELQLPRA